MKKISLKNINLQEIEQLSREQLRKVMGGFSIPIGGDDDEEASSCWSSCLPADPVRYECTRGDCEVSAGFGVWCRDVQIHWCDKQ